MRKKADGMNDGDKQDLNQGHSCTTLVQQPSLNLQLPLGKEEIPDYQVKTTTNTNKLQIKFQFA